MKSTWLQNKTKVSRFKIFLPYGITLLASAGLINYITRTDILDKIDFQTFRWDYFGLVIFFEMVAFALRGLILAEFVAIEGLRLKVIEWFGLSVVSNLANLLIPISGGVTARASYLKIKYGFSLLTFTALLAASYLIIFFISGGIGLFLLLEMLLFSQQSVNILVYLALLLMVFFPLIIRYIPFEKITYLHDGFIMRRIEGFIVGWIKIRENPRLLMNQSLIIIGLQIIQSLSLYFSFRIISQPIPILNVLLIGVLTNLTNFIRITPGALGVKEAVTGFATNLIGYSLADGVGAAVISRLGQWSITFLLGPVFVFLLMRRLEKQDSSE